MKDRKERIYQYLQEVCACNSVSCTHDEYKAGDWFAEFFRKIPYFQKHPELTGNFMIPGDPYHRSVPWAILLDPTSVEAELAKRDLDAEARFDMNSGEWIWGRGVGDMKGGHCVHLALFEEYAELADKGELPGCYIYLPVPDEESYSVGMREGAKILRRLIEQYQLDVQLMIIPEPSNWVNGKQSLSRGTVGKIMPVVMAQGVTAHVGHCFNGISPMNFLCRIYQRTNNALEFCDSYDGEAAVPPTWQKFRDNKELYDVTIPLRAYGYFTLLHFERTPEQIMNRLKEISMDALKEECELINAQYQEYKKIDKSADKEKIVYYPEVYTFGELVEKIKSTDKEGFEKYYSEVYAGIKEDIEAGRTNYPDATVTIMQKVMDYADLKQPTVLLGFAPPYYPAVNGDAVEGKENAALKAYEVIEKSAREHFGRETFNEHYFMGISDGSYTAVGHPFDYDKFSLNTPCYGQLYSVDFKTIEANNIPFILYGPITKEYHQWTERTLKKSLLEELPVVTKELIDSLWK